MQSFPKAMEDFGNGYTEFTSCRVPRDFMIMPLDNMRKNRSRDIKLPCRFAAARARLYMMKQILFQVINPGSCIAYQKQHSQPFIFVVHFYLFFFLFLFAV